MHTPFSFADRAVSEVGGDALSVAPDDSVNNVVDRLLAVNWDFPARARHTDLEALHPYPAKFIADLPQALLANLPVMPGGRVLDPFNGSGTTLAACQRNGNLSVGIDLNPIACLVAKVRTSPLPPDVETTAAETIERARSRGFMPPPPIPNLDHWFKIEVQDALTRLTATIDELPDGPVADILRLALSSIIVRVSNQDSDTRYAAVLKSVGYEDVFVAYQRAVTKVVSALEGRSYDLCQAEIIEADTLNVEPERIGKIGLVITSPPYPNAYEYWLYHKYRMWWLGKNPVDVKSKEIGARAHFFKGKSSHTADDFERQMTSTFDLLSRAMLDGAYACFVVGRSRIRGEVVDNAEIIRRSSAEMGFQHVASIDRNIASTKKSFNLSHANIKTETIVVVRK
jgi:site-specific DNA-methyltransferase (cytosine-N4-specific)